MDSTQVLRHHFIGATLLIAGCCIGAGMLGLPLITSLSGFVPSLLLLTLAWAFMTVTGLLLVEIYLYFSDRISLVSMAKRTTGKFGALICWVTFLFLFYCLLIAYVSGGGTLLVDLFRQYFHFEIQEPLTMAIMTSFLGLFIYLGTEATDRMNRLLMVGLLVTYTLLIFFALPFVRADNLQYAHWEEALYIMPPFIVSFGYHNLIPGLSFYLKRNVKAIRWAVIFGSSIPFLIYLLWEFVMLGVVPLEGESGFVAALERGLLPAQILRGVVGNPWVSHIAELFTLFAVTTSFLAVALSVTDFLADGLKMPKNNRWNRLILCLMVLIPPFLFALSNPTLFITALKYAGGVGAVILYGILPCVMVWRGRYHLNVCRTPLVPGGKIFLIFLILVSCGVIFLHICDQIGWCL